MRRFLLFGKTEQKQSPEQDTREKEVLKSLRKEVGARIRLAEKKESQLLTLHKRIVERETALHYEEERITKLKKDEESLRSNISVLQRAYDEKKSALDERQRIILQLTKEMSVLTQKKSEIRRVELQLKQDYDADKKLREQVDKMERRVADGVSITAKQQQEIEKYSALLKDLRSQISEGLPVKKQLDAELEERQKIVLKVRSELSEMEKELKVLLKTREDIRKRNALVTQRESQLAATEGKLQDMRKELDYLYAELKAARVDKDKVEAELEEKKRNFSQIRKDLPELEKEVKVLLKTREDIKKRNALVTQRESQLAATEGKLQDMRKEIESMRSQAESIEKNKQELFALIEEKKHLIEDMKLSIAESHEKMSEAHKRETAARKAEHELLAVQRDTDKKLKLIEEKSLEMTRREAAFLDHERALKDAARILAKDKHEFADEVNTRKAELLLVQQEWEKKLDSLNEQKTDMKREKDDVRRLVETDVLGLKEKEDELIEAIAMMERDKDRLVFEEKSLLKKVSELEKEKAAVEKVVKELSAKEKQVVDGERIVQKGMKFIEDEKKVIDKAKDELYRARELKRLLPQMEHRYTELRKNIAKTEARLIGEKVEPSASRIFKERVKDLSVREKGVELEVRRLIENEREVEQLEQRKEKAFSEYLREEVERVEHGKPGREIMNPQIHGMIDDAREKVMKGDLDEAVRLVAEAEYLVDKLQDASQKRLFYYDIRDLKTSIKLASLT